MTLEERVARAIWRSLYGQRGEEHAFEFHTSGEREAMEAARAAIVAFNAPYGPADPQPEATK
jgi:hypothetical protein